MLIPQHFGYLEAKLKVESRYFILCITYIITIFLNLSIKKLFCYFTGIAELYTRVCGAYDTVHMIMALPLIPENMIIEGFTSIQIYYNENNNIVNWELGTIWNSFSLL